MAECGALGVQVHLNALNTEPVSSETELDSDAARGWQVPHEIKDRISQRTTGFGALVLWCFVLNPHRRPRHPKLLRCDAGKIRLSCNAAADRVPGSLTWLQGCPAHKKHPPL